MHGFTDRLASTLPVLAGPLISESGESRASIREVETQVLFSPTGVLLSSPAA